MIYLPGDLSTIQASDKIPGPSNIPLALFSILEGKKYRKILARLLQLKIPTKVRLALYIHKQEMFEGKMGNCLSPSLIKIELSKVVVIWKISKVNSDTYR